MKTKFTVSMVVTVEHPEGTKVPKKVIAQHLQGLLGGFVAFRKTSKGPISETFTKVTIRSIDFD